MCRYARAVWVASRAGEALPQLSSDESARLEDVLGDVYHDAVEVVRSYAIGDSRSRDTEEPPADFAPRLKLILKGFAPESQAVQPSSDEEPNAVIFQQHLWQLLRKVRESAELSYAREVDLPELDRRILFLLHSSGPQVPAAISSAVGMDKAQVSRSVKRLLQQEMVERTQIRSPIALTEKGQSAAARLLRLAELRNRELSFDIDDEELEGFFVTVDVLLHRAASLYEQERALSQGGPVGDSIFDGIRPFQVRRTDGAIVIDRGYIVSPLLTLSAYFTRSAALTYKRLASLSNFEAWVLSEICQNPPVEWARLVRGLERDHSQAGRTVNALIERDIVFREGKPGRRFGRFSPTEEGKRLYAIIQDLGFQRSKFMLEPLSEQQLQAFMATFSKLKRNSVAQLEREHALEEYGSR
ncbi:MarR family transcriptional regulator [Altericroceibacterium endophyticum]|uniref:MarR family transcriptional regulator n=1 Tax=Altericroceibacterium endophyticum TaxID=1808508 RepID=A0A6I4T0E6_9SPHN|nr:MarR family transcriptional regulator [Altericroceibacterium endophyticum]MXO64408.1 MarR family transcriptional regulator [Altericroceibacterium endophyticum]